MLNERSCRIVHAITFNDIGSVVYLDIERAFDSTRIRSVLSQLVAAIRKWVKKSVKQHKCTCTLERAQDMMRVPAGWSVVTKPMEPGG